MEGLSWKVRRESLVSSALYYHQERKDLRCPHFIHSLSATVRLHQLFDIMIRKESQKRV